MDHNFHKALIGSCQPFSSGENDQAHGNTNYDRYTLWFFFIFLQNKSLSLSLSTVSSVREEMSNFQLVKDAGP